MMRYCLYVVIAVTLSVNFNLVLSQTTGTATELDQKLVEKDQRLHSDGKGWKLNQAQRGEANLPKVLLIGDSILGGYGKQVVTELKDKAYVDYWVQPYHQGHMQGTYLSTMIKDVLAHGPYDVITFNFGLHGWQPGRIPEGQFIPLTHKLVKCIRDHAPDAKLIWVSSTPITQRDGRPKYWELPAREKPLEVDPKDNPYIVEHNLLAAEVMVKEKVPVVDFYSLMQSHMQWARGDQYHWNTPAYDLMAITLAKAIEPLLGMQSGVVHSVKNSCETPSGD